MINDKLWFKGIDQFLGSDFLFIDWSYWNFAKHIQNWNNTHFVDKHFLIFNIFFEKMTIFTFFGALFGNIKGIEVKKQSILWKSTTLDSTWNF